MKIKCVYCLDFTDGKRYIGSTKDLVQRIKCHNYPTNSFKTNPELKAAVLQGDYKVVILEHCPDDYNRKQLEAREQHYINLWFDYGILYNKHKNVSGWSKGKKQSAEHRANNSAAKKGRPSPIKGIPQTAEHRANLSAAKKGRPSPIKGIPQSAEHRANIGAANRSQVWQYADEINALRASGMPYYEIGKQYNCSPGTISRICLS